MNNNTKIIIGVVCAVILGVYFFTLLRPAKQVSNTNDFQLSDTDKAPEANDANSNCTNCLRHYADAAKTIRFDYDSNFNFTEGGSAPTMDWRQGAKQNGFLIATVVIPQSFLPGTNFDDAKLTIGNSPYQEALNNCASIDKEIGEKAPTNSKIGAVPFLKYKSSGAAAGNIYETTSYRAIVNNNCYAIEYTIHSGNIGNYPPESGIKSFDKAKVVSALEKIVQSILFLGKGK